MFASIHLRCVLLFANIYYQSKYIQTRKVIFYVVFLKEM